MSYLLTLETIGCINHSGGAGNDDLYFKVYIDKSETARFIPDEPATKNSWDIDEGKNISLQPISYLQNGNKVLGTLLKFKFNNNIRVEIWDYDWSSGDDFLGEADFKWDDTPNGKKKLSNDDEGSEYTLDYSINEIK